MQYYICEVRVFGFEIIKLVGGGILKCNIEIVSILMNNLLLIK